MHIELNLPEQKIGEWSLETFYKNEIKYQRLMKGELVLMVNTPDITKDYVEFLTEAKGAVHINGLGIGMSCQYLLGKQNITEVTVVEYEKTIIDLVAPYFSGDERFEIIHADAYAYTPSKGKYYDFVWHDIWTQRVSFNLKQMEILFKKYEPFAKKQDAWSRQICMELERKEWLFNDYSFKKNKA